MLFKKRKKREEKVLETKKKMQELFSQEIEDSDSYNLIYAYNQVFNPKINDYTYNSMVLGYKDDNVLVILETDKELKDIYSVRKITKENFKKATHNIRNDTYTIYLDNKKKDKIKFITVEKNYIDVDILAFIEQEIEVEEFKEFFQEFRIKPHLHIKKK